MPITIKTGEVYVATSQRNYPNFDFSCQLPSGAVEVLQFRNATFCTENEEVASILDKEVNSLHCPWLIEGKVMPKAQLDPLFALREKIRQEELAKLATGAVTNSESKNSGGGLATSATISEKAIAAAAAKNSK